MPNDIATEYRGNALLITFNRPQQGNALNLDMANQLFQILKPVGTDRAIRVVVLRGAGGNFMTGMDYGMYKDFTAGIEQNNELLLPYHSAIRELYGMDKPVVSIVEGRASGPGFSLMLASDLVIAGKSAVFNSGFVANAMSSDGGATFFLTRKAGMAKATEILMLNQDFDAATAEHIGLVNRVTDDGNLQETALQWVDQLASGPTRAYGAMKRLIGKAVEQDINAQLSLEHTYWGASSRTFDFRSAMRAYFVKQPVKYTGA